MQINMEILFLKERFFYCFFYRREPIRLIQKTTSRVGHNSNIKYQKVKTKVRKSK